MKEVDSLIHTSTNTQADELLTVVGDDARISSVDMRRMMLTTPTAVKAILRKLGRGFPFSEIVLSNRGIGDEDVLCVANALRINDTVKTLALDYNSGVGPPSGAHLASLLSFNVALTSLDLAGNNLGSEGCVALASALQLNSTLTELRLESNKIGDAGAMSLAQNLKGNETLLTLNLWTNGIGPKGGKALSDLLRTGPSGLNTLSLSGNPLKNTQQGVVILAAVDKYLLKNRRKRVEEVLDLVRELTDFFYDIVQIIDAYLHDEATY